MGNGKKERGLTEKQRRFCELWAIEPNATKAALGAGYSKNTAQQMGSENLSKPVILDYISDLRKDTEQLLGFNKETLLNELKSIALQNVSDYLEGWGKLKDFDEVSNNKKKAITLIDIVETSSMEGERVTTTKLKLGDKVKAITELARIMGYDKEENTGASGEFSVTINPMVDLSNETSLINNMTNANSQL